MHNTDGYNTSVSGKERFRPLNPRGLVTRSYARPLPTFFSIRHPGRDARASFSKAPRAASGAITPTESRRQERARTYTRVGIPASCRSEGARTAVVSDAIRGGGAAKAQLFYRIDR